MIVKVKQPHQLKGFQRTCTKFPSYHHQQHDHDRDSHQVLLQAKHERVSKSSIHIVGNVTS